MGRIALLVAVALTGCSAGTFTGSESAPNDDAGGEGGADEPSSGGKASSSGNGGADASSSGLGGSGGSSGAPVAGSSSSGDGGRGGQSSSGAGGELGGTAGALVAGSGGSNHPEGWACSLPDTWDDPACATACETFDGLEHGPAGFCSSNSAGTFCQCPAPCDACKPESCPAGMQCAVSGGCYPPGEIIEGQSCEAPPGWGGYEVTNCGPGLVCGPETSWFCRRPDCT